MRVPVRTSPPLWLRALRHLPRNALSRLAGRFAGARLPPALVRAEIALFARAVGADLSEMRDPIDRYPTLQAFFTRALRDGARPIDAAPESLVAPCDGAWGESGVVRDGLALQLKGRPYSLSELLGDAADAARFEGGAFATFYLAPRDYHRFHSPCAARVERATYLPGSLWPVNAAGLASVEALFAQNERICAFLRTAPGDALLCLVAVGATMVGKVRVTFDALETNRPGASVQRRAYADVRLAKGEEWGRFEFGSTLVLLAEPGRATLEPRPSGSRLRLGERIGRL
jgi:phosphatidylserine decarboxylase